MVKGITNAKIISGGSGGGDTVYAVSETALNKDDKVYLNKHYYDGYEAASDVLGSGSRGTYYRPYVCNNGDVIHPYGDTLRINHYDSENKTWSILETKAPFLNNNNASGVMVEKRDGLLVATMCNPRYGASYIIQGERVTTIEDYVARRDLAIVGTNSSSVALKEIVNINTGEIGQTYSTIVARSGGSYVSNYCCDENTLLITEGTYYMFYDISDLTSPVKLNSGQTLINCCVTGYTGLGVGDYLFTRDGTGRTEYGRTTAQYCTIYKILEDYTLKIANDLPEEFYKYLADPTSSYIYNKENKTLSVGDSTSVSLYKWIEGTFKKLSYNVPLFDISLETYCGFCLFVSEDLSTAVVGASPNTSSGGYFNSIIYKMTNNNDNWYAEDYIHSNAISLQGFATGKTNDKGEYEISTVLPAKVNLTINTNVDTEVEIFGSVE